MALMRRFGEADTSIGFVHTSIKCFALFDHHCSVVSLYSSE